MCGEQSTEWDYRVFVKEVYSFVEMHEISGLSVSIMCAVIDLKEGTRMVANLAGVEPADVKIGMKVQGKVEQVDADTMLPQFYPV